MSDQNAAEALAGSSSNGSERHDRIMAVGKALRLLEAGDTPGYNAKMREKAELLAALGEDAKPLLAGLPGELRFNLALALERFRAAPQYRWASIRSFTCPPCYPEDHKQGEPDDLTVCIDTHGARRRKLFIARRGPVRQGRRI